MWRGALGALLMACAPALSFAACTTGDGDWIAQACYEQRAPVHTVYGHDVLGGTPEWNVLRVDLGPRGRDLARGGSGRIVLAMPEGRIIEDVAPRIAQVDGAGPPEVVLVIADTRKGAQLAVFDVQSADLVTTPFIGRANRWLAPVGVADLDGDGAVELAYVDRPHLAKVLRVWRYRDGRLDEVATLEGVSNHRIGEDFISGGIRSCGDGPEMIVASADWTRGVAVRFDGARLAARDLGPLQGAGDMASAMLCQ